MAQPDRVFADLKTPESSASRKLEKLNRCWSINGLRAGYADLGQSRGYEAFRKNQKLAYFAQTFAQLIEGG